MNNWEIINVVDYKNYSAFYSEEYGLISHIRISGYPVDKDGNHFQRIYADYNTSTYKKSISLYDVSGYSFDLDTIFSLTFYRRKEKSQRNYYYQNPIIEADADKIDEIKFGVTINYDAVCLNSSGNLTTTTKSQSLIISSKNELKDKDIKIWATKDEVKSYAMPVLMDLQVGQKYFYIDNGVCEVVEVYDYPNKLSNNICRIAFANGTEQDVAIGDKKFVYIPLEYKSELLQFNKALRELALQPIMQRNQEHNLINVMWQPIEDAARYVVKLYRCVNTDNRRKVYFLKEYEVDRNEHFLSISDLIVNGHIIVVIAENRSGEVVAQSRGIDIASSNGEPKWW